MKIMTTTTTTATTKSTSSYVTPKLGVPWRIRGCDDYD
jgi:hypothetical protein